jgi:hypothetical protein
MVQHSGRRGTKPQERKLNRLTGLKGGIRGTPNLAV